MGKINTWYVCAIQHESLPFGYQQITPKGKFHKTLEEAQAKKLQHEWVEVYPVVVLKRTCEVM